MYRAQENSGNFSDKVESIETSRLDLFVCSFVGAWTAGTSLADPAPAREFAASEKLRENQQELAQSGRRL